MRKQVDEFLTFLTQERRLSAHTVAAYRNDLGQLLVYLESPRAARLRSEASGTGSDVAGRAEVIDFVLELRERDYAPATIARKIAATRSLFHYLSDRGEVGRDPTTDLGGPTVRKPLPRTLSVKDVAQLLSRAARRAGADGIRNRAMLQLLYSTGMRVTELVSLDVPDIDLAARLVRCVGRAGRVRRVPIEDPAAQTLAEYLQQGRPVLARSEREAQALFLNQRGDRLTRQGFWLIMKAMTRESGISAPVTPHTLRHSFAAHRLGDGVALERLRELLGHANISTTQIYTQIRVNAERSAGAEVSNERNPELTPVTS